MAKLNHPKKSTGKRILLVGDEVTYLSSTASIIRQEGHEVVSAASGEDALKLLYKEHFDLMLLDYYMPGHLTGEDVVKEVRKFNSYVQIILQTDHSTKLPRRKMLQRLDIQGYHNKSDGPEKLLIWVDIGLKAAYTVNLLNKSRQGLRYILDATPELHKTQPLKDLLQGILLQISGLLGIVNTFLAVIPIKPGKTTLSDGFIAMFGEDTNLVISAATGRFTEQPKSFKTIDSFNLKSEKKIIYEALKKNRIQISGNCTVLPLSIGEMCLGVIYLEQKINSDMELELMYVFANQASVAVQNARLYEIATQDSLTGVYIRRFFYQCFIRELRNAFRGQTVLTFLMLDIDKLKNINDTAGHLAGDQALVMLSKIMLKATRNTDFVGRYGGDEFAIILPQTQKRGAEVVAERIFQSLKNNKVKGPKGGIKLQVSIGTAETTVMNYDLRNIPRPLFKDYFEKMAKILIETADRNLYNAKKEGGNRMCHNLPTEWPALR